MAYKTSTKLKMLAAICLLTLAFTFIVQNRGSVEITLWFWSWSLSRSLLLLILLGTGFSIGYLTRVLSQARRLQSTPFGTKVAKG